MPLKPISAFAEISAGKISIDALRVRGDDPTLADIHVPPTTVHCRNALTFDTPGVGTYTCTINGGPSVVKDRVITLSRDVDGGWSCQTTVAQRFVGTAALCTGTGQ